MTWEIKHGDWIERLKELLDESVHCVVTSPPYWGLRDYGTAGQLGLEKTPEEYISKMVSGFREVRRVLRKDGTLWLNMGDCYQGGDRGVYGKSRVVNKSCLSNKDHLDVMFAPHRMPLPGLKAKDLVGLPWMLAFALRADGWYLRSDIIWAKPNPMPESVTDRPTKAHEYVFLLTKSSRYFYDAEAIKEESISGDPRKPYAPGQVDSRGNGHDRGGGQLRKVKIPGGWDLGDGAHGTIHRKGRTAAEYQEIEVSPYRNKRSVWEIATSPFPEAHFATFPPKLIEPCILAGTSERGCCPECGAPWGRIIESAPLPKCERTPRRPQITGNDSMSAGIRKTHDNWNGPELARWKAENPPRIGWQQSCRCNAGDPIPCTVLDPFCGAGTTGLVALRYHRNFIGIELKQEYVEMAKRRIEQDAPLFNLTPEQATPANTKGEE